MKTIFTVLLSTLMLTTTFAQDFPKLDISPMDVALYPSSYRVNHKLIKVIYSRPQLKGRSLDLLAPLGEVWRTGANEATEVTLYKDFNFGGIDVEAGTYSLFTIPNEDTWTIILSSDTNLWGAYNYNKANDVVRIETKVSYNEKESLEAFSITFENYIMYLGWDTLRVAIPFKVK